MRLDKYLKVSRLIKRRTVANEACDGGRVMINDKPAKALLQGLPKQPVEVYDAENGKLLGTATDGTFPVDFGPWGVRLLRLEKAK